MALTTSSNKFRVITTNNTSGLATSSKFSDINSPALVVNTSEGGVFYTSGNSSTLTQLAALPNHSHSNYSTTDHTHANYLSVPAYNYTNGCLVRTNIPTSSNTMATFRIEGNSYGSGSTIFTTGHFYNYTVDNNILSCQATHFGFNFGNINVFCYDGYVHLWFEQTSSYQSFIVYVYSTNNGADCVNRVSYITNGAMPSSGVTRLVEITPRKGLDNYNYSSYCASVGHTHSYLPLSGGTITSTGQGIATLMLNSIDNSGHSILQFANKGTYLGGLGFSSVDTPYFRTTAGAVRNLIHSGNIGQQSVLNATNATTANSATKSTNSYRLLSNPDTNSVTQDNAYDTTAGLHFWKVLADASNNNNDGFIFQWSWNPGSVGGQIYVDDNPTSTMMIRGRDTDGTYKDWNKFLHSGNYTNYCSSVGHTHNYAGSSTAGGAATSVVCSAATSNVDRPIVVTSENNGLYYSAKAKLNYSTGNITAPTFTGNLVGNADSATKATYVIDYGNTASNIQIGYSGTGLTSTTCTHLAGYTSSGTKIKDITAAEVKKWLSLGSAAYTESGAYLPISGGSLTGHLSSSDYLLGTGLIRVNAAGSTSNFGYIKAETYDSNRSVVHIGSNYGGSASISNSVSYDAIGIYRTCVGIGGTFTGATLKSNYDAGIKLDVSGNVKATKFIGALQGNADTATNATKFNGLEDSYWYRTARGTYNGENDLTTIPVSSGGYILTHSGWTGAAFVLQAGGSNSNLGFIIRGGAKNMPEVITTTDNKSTNWINKGTLITSSNYTEYCASVGHTHNYAASSHTHTWADINSTITNTDEFCFVPSGYNNNVFFNWRSKGGAVSDSTVTGYLFCNGHGNSYAPCTASNFITSSDKRLKTNIKEIDNSSKSLELNFYEFDYKDNDNHSAGHIAQEVKEVLPEFVHEDTTEEHMLSIDYTGLHSIQIKALIDENNIMKKEIKELKELIKMLINEK